MKNTYSIAQRNALVEEHLPRIDAVMRHNRKVIRDARLDQDDVYQQLALRLIRAVANFDPDKGDLETHITAQLNHELRNCLHPHSRFGVTNTSEDLSGKIISLEVYRSNAERREMAMAA